MGGALQEETVYDQEATSYRHEYILKMTKYVSP